MTKLTDNRYGEKEFIALSFYPRLFPFFLLIRKILSLLVGWWFVLGTSFTPSHCHTTTSHTLTILCRSFHHSER